MEQYKDLHIQYEKQAISASYITYFKPMDKPAMAKKNKQKNNFCFRFLRKDINDRS